jgi:tryptophan halogenase
VAAELFVDCTGAQALLRSRLDQAYADWSRWLSADRVLLGASPPDPEPGLLDHADALAAGWRWRSPGLVRTSHGIAYASAQLDDDSAARVLADAGAREIAAPVSIRQGRRVQPWLRNCVAVGDAAVSVEPLEWTNLHLAHSAMDRIVSMMPGRACAPVELAEYNRQSEAEADRVRDLLALHYAASDRPEPFWRDAAAAALPDSLAHTLTLFRERGRLPFYEEETFSRDSWLAVLLGQGVMPRRVDPLAESIPLETAKQEMARMRGAVSALAAAVPPYGAYLRNLMRQDAR